MPHLWRAYHTRTSRMTFGGSSSLRFLGALRGALLALALALPFAAGAQGIGVSKATVSAVEDGWQVDADFDVQFSPQLEEAVNKGIPLYFVVDFEMARPRWYWFDEKPVVANQTYKITYAPLLRQYRVAVGSVYQNFSTFK